MYTKRIIITVIALLIGFAIAVWLTLPVPAQSNDPAELPTAKDIEHETIRSIESRITKAANRVGLSPTTALRIATCESGLREDAKNPVSSASGIFQITRATFEDAVRLQFIDYTWYDVLDANKNIEVAIWYMSKGQYWRWAASENCWSYAKTQ